MESLLALLGQEAKIRLPNVDEVMDIGYALHASDDPALRDTEAQKLARQIVDDFRVLHPENYTEAAYLSCARSIVLAFGRAISRRKEQWKDELRAAQLERQQAVEKMRETSVKNAWLLAFFWKTMPAVMLFMTGLVITQTVDPLPSDATKTMTWVASVIGGGLLALIGRWVGLWVRDLHRNGIEVRYNSQLFQAHILYEEKKAEELRYYRARMCEAWEQYAGEKYPNTASYELVMAGDIETRREVERSRLSFTNKTTLRLMLTLARLLRGKRKGEKDEPLSQPALREL